MAIRAVFTVVGLWTVLIAGSVSAEFSIDTVSPDVPAVAEGDILIGFTNLTPPPLVVTPAASFGLLIGEELDALSNGIDTICPAGSPNCFTIISFSVDRATAGMATSVVAGQVAGNGAAGDVFQFEVTGAGVVLVPTSVNTDAPQNSLTIAPQSSIDALATAHNVFTAEYFSIAPSVVAAASVRWGMPGLSPADILLGPGPVPTVYATEAGLGLVPGDDIDGIAINDAAPVGVLSPTDVIYITLAPGSPSLAAIPASAADILQASPGVPAVIYGASLMGLLPSDNLDAISMLDPPINSVPSIGPAAMLAAVVLFAGTGAGLLWNRGRATSRA